MKRFLSILLAAALSLMAVPASALADEVSETAGSDNPTVGSGEEARSLDELLQAGDYVPGRVLAHVNDDFAPVSAYSSNGGGWSASNLYTFDPQPEAGAEADVPLARSMPTPEQVILIESGTQSTEDLLRDLAHPPGVLAAQPDYVRYIDDLETQAKPVEEPAAALSADTAPTDDPLIGLQWHLAPTDEIAGAANVETLWGDEGIPGRPWQGKEEVVVAVVDTGVDCTNPDLKDVMWENPGNIGLEGEHGYDYGMGDDDPMDNDGHGTHVAGIIAASVNNGEGVAGVAPNAKIMALRVANESGGFLTSAVLGAYSYMKKAAQARVNLVAANNSWMGAGESPLLTEVMDDLYRSNGVLSVCASGNYAADLDQSLNLPAGAPTDGAIAVNAVDREGRLASFSDYGAAATDLAAPGTDILSTAPQGQGIVDGDDPELTVAFDDFESEDRMFSFQASGDAEPSVSRAEVPQVVGDAPSQGVLMSIKQAKAGQKASVVFTAKKGAVKQGLAAADKTVDDLQCLAFDAGVADSKESDMGRLLRVSVHGIDGSWIDLTPESFGTGGAIPLSLRVPIPKDKRDEINWDEFSFKLERTFTSFDDGMDLDFFFDNVALVSDVAPYVYMDGTSMAAPVVTGSCALLAGLFPNDGAEQLRARILGGVKRADALAGTCTSDGQLDVVRAATDPYPVVDALEPAADGTLEATVRGSWFGEDRGRVTLDGADLEVKSWGANEVRVVLPPSLESKQRYVQVERADGDTGRRKVAVGSEEGFDFFESLPAPDFKSLGLPEPTLYNAWSMAAAAGRVYAVPHFESSDGRERSALLAYDPASASWSVQHLVTDTLDAVFRLTSSGGVLYALTSDQVLYSFDPSTGTLGDPVDCRDSLTACGFGGFDFMGVTLASDGRSLWVFAGLDASGASSPLVARVDMATGDATALPDLGEGRFTPFADMVNGVLTVAAGNVNWIESRIVNSVAAFEGDEWNYAPFPQDIVLNQYGAVAGGVLPAGSTIAGSTASHERIILSGAVEAGNQGSDTFVYDPKAGTWLAVPTRLSASKVSLASGAVLGDALYVAGMDSLTKEMVFKRLKFELAPDEEGGGGTPDKPTTDPGEEQPKPLPDAPDAPASPQEALKPSAEAAKPKPLTATGDPLAPRTAALALAAVSALAVAGLVVAVRRSRSRR